MWTADVTLAGSSVDVTVRDGNGMARGNTTVKADVMHDDFMYDGSVEAMTDASGHATLTLPPSAGANRFVHVTAGLTYPLVEKILALP